MWRIGTQVKEALVANNMDIDHEKRSEFAKALAGDEVELKGNDDETFLGSKELPDLIAAAKEALVKIGKSGDELDKIMPGSPRNGFRDPKPAGVWPMA